MGENLIDVKNLKKIFLMGKEKVVALNNINLQIKKGEICSLIGTSGSGKSTLLNMLAGLEKPTKGNIDIGGIHIEKLNEYQLARFRRYNLGFIFQSYNLLTKLTAKENVMMPLIFKGMGLKEREKKAKEMLEFVGLGDRLDHKPKEMSGGQQQRVAIARAFVNKPKIIFADEPTGNLDTHTTIEVIELMTRFAREYNQTLVIVSHDLEIVDYSDKIVHMRDGEIKEVEIKNK